MKFANTNRKFTLDWFVSALNIVTWRSERYAHGIIFIALRLRKTFHTSFCDWVTKHYKEQISRVSIQAAGFTRDILNCKF